MGFAAVDATFKLPGQAVSSAKGDPPDHSTMHYTSHQGSYFAHRITLEGLGQDALAQSLSTARVDLNPHQVDVALFALSSPLSKGALLADEVGLGKTIEAGLAIAQRWAERKRHILLIVPASLRKQWSQELFDKFSTAVVDPRKRLLQRGPEEGGGVALLPGRADRDHVLRICGCQG
jgi:hypothetical protein